MPPNPQGFREAGEGRLDGTGMPHILRTPANYDHFEYGHAPVKDAECPGAGSQGCCGTQRLTPKVPVARPRELGIAGVQATDLHAPLRTLLGRRHVCSRNGLLNTMAELFSITAGEVRIAVGFVQTLCRGRPIRPFGKEAVILHRSMLELSCVWHSYCLSGLKLRPG